MDEQNVAALNGGSSDEPELTFDNFEPELFLDAEQDADDFLTATTVSALEVFHDRFGNIPMRISVVMEPIEKDETEPPETGEVTVFEDESTGADHSVEVVVFSGLPEHLSDQMNPECGT